MNPPGPVSVANKYQSYYQYYGTYWKQAARKGGIIRSRFGDSRLSETRRGVITDDMSPFKEEHVLFIIPGSQTTRAQLGINDTYAPIHHEFKTRMFPAGEGKWEPYKVRKVNKPKKNTAAQPASGDGDVALDGTDTKMEEGEESEYEEDLESEDGAVYPIKEGRIVNMPAFLALMHHVHATLSPTLHTPILIISQPAWTVSQIEELVRFFFEQFKTPALSIADSALTTAWGFNAMTACIIDVGFEKTDITAVVEFCVSNVGRTIALPESGGEAMTQQLHTLLEPKGWNYDMCEQLKKSPICEILPAGVPLPVSDSSEKDTSIPTDTNTAAAASTDAPSAGANVAITSAPAAPAIDGEAEDDIADKVVDDEGVLDVATIVASGKTQEFLAAQEKKKAAAAARKVTRDAEKATEAAAAARAIKLPNYKRHKAIFHYQEKRIGAEAAAPIDVDAVAKPSETSATELAGAPVEGEVQKPAETGTETAASAEGTAAGAPVEEASASAPAPAIEASATFTATTFTAQREAARAAKREEKRKAREAGTRTSILRRDLEVGTERFQAVPPRMLERIADAVHRTIMSGGVEPAMRADLWDHVIITGNGSKVKGFREALFSTLTSKYLISPSSATIFTSELPSNLSTPMGTGAQTPSRDGSLPLGQQPLPSFGGGSSVNPLLLAATTNSLNPGGSTLSVAYGGSAGGHSSHSQTPTSIKLAKMPEYFPEWKSIGDSEVVALGAQVMARVIFINDHGTSAGFMTRPQYNDSGPSGIHTFGMTIV